MNCTIPLREWDIHKAGHLQADFGYRCGIVALHHGAGGETGRIEPDGAIKSSYVELKHTELQAAVQLLEVNRIAGIGEAGGKVLPRH